MKKRLFAGAAAALCCAGLAMAQPANDTCANAIPVAIPSMTSGTTTGATVESPAPPTCTTTYSAPGVWYTLVGNGHTLTLDLCNSNYDTKLHVYCNTSDPCTSGFGCVTGNDDTSGCGTGAASRVSFCSALGQTYYVLVSGFSSSTGDFTLNVADGADCTNPIGCAVGACCSSTGTCTTVSAGGCTGTSTFQGAGTTCTPNPCTALLGACCGTGSAPSCSLRIASGCTGTSTFMGTGSVCSPSPCTALVGACCSGTGTCTRTTANACTGTSSFQGVASVCTPTNPCTALLGTCCNNTTGACTFVTQVACGTAGTWTSGGACSPSPCPANGACCIGSCCSVQLASICGSNGGTYQGDATVCTTNPCPAPANDVCTGAIAVTAGVPVSGDNCNATSTGDGPAASCQPSSGKGVWYSFASPGGLFDIGTCGSPQDTVLTVFTSPDCVAFTQVTGGCDDDTCDGVNPPGSGFASFINNLSLPAGNYLIRVSSFGTAPAGNTFTLLVSNVVSGACCDATTGACSLAEPGACPSGTNYQGDGTVCEPNSCPQPIGACCNPDGTCSIGSGTACAAAGGLFQGNGSSCNSAVDPCPVAAGACCNNTTGVCTYVAGAANCSATTSTYSGDGSVCSPNTCAQPGACCTGTTCTTVTDNGCSGDFLGVGVACEASTCTIGACCIASSATCIQTNATLCANAGGVYSGDGTVCSNLTVGSPLFSSGNTFPISIPDSTPAGVTATIVIPAGSGTVSGLNVAIGLTHTWVGDLIVTLSNGSTTVTLVNRPGVVSGGSTVGYSTDLAGQYVFTDVASTPFATAAATGPALAAGSYKPAQALSAFDGAPFEGTWTLSVSDNAGGDTGTIGGLDFVSVTVTPTCEFSGACCCGSSCSLTTAAACTGTNSVFSGSGTVCNVPGNISSPCCLADYNHAGGVSVQDIFDFLAGYFSGNPCADINGGGTSVQDIFDFLAAYFSGGCM